MTLLFKSISNHEPVESILVLPPSIRTVSLNTRAYPYDKMFRDGQLGSPNPNASG